MCNGPELGCRRPISDIIRGSLRTAGVGLGQLQIRQFGTLWWHLCLIVMQGRLDLTEETGKQGIKAWSRGSV